MNTPKPESRSSCLYPAVERDEPLKVAVVLGQSMVPVWVREFLDDIKESDFAKVEFLVVQDTTRSARNIDMPERRWTLSGGLFSLYSGWDEWLHPDESPAAMADELGFEVHRVEANAAAVPQSLSDVLGHRHLDVVVDLGFAGDSSCLARFSFLGVLRCAFGTADEQRAGPALLWRIHDSEAKAGTVLRVVHETSTGITEATSSFASTGDSIWLSKHRQAGFFTMATLLLRALRDLASDAAPSAEQVREREIVSAPTNSEMASFLHTGSGRVLRKKLRKLTSEVQWLLAYRTDSSKFVSSGGGLDLSGFTPLLPAKDHCYADPCAIRRGGTDYVFIEDWHRKMTRGTIAVIPIDAEGNVGHARPVLSREHHLSYPFVFEWEGEIYMVPDTSEIKRVQLLRAKTFPYEWEWVSDLLSGHVMVDSTLHAHEDYWYMFVNARERYRGSLNDELFLFFAKTPLGPWQPHPANPIRSDVRRARPAGRLIERKGRWIRPSQDCSQRYGGRINLNEVCALSPGSYEERILGHIDPACLPGFDGCHTITSTDRVEVIDVRRTISKFGRAADRL